MNMDELKKKFKETEDRYKELKNKLTSGEITTDQMKSELMRLMVQDETGKYWMLGGKTGRWYLHNGSQWIESDPYERFVPAAKTEIIIPDEPQPKNEVKPFSFLEKEPEKDVEPAKVIDTREFGIIKEEEEDKPFKIKSESEFVAPVSQPVNRDYEFVHCKYCQSRIPPYAAFCSFCGANQKEPAGIMKETVAPSPIKSNQEYEEIIIKAIKPFSLMFFLGGFGALTGLILGATFGIFKQSFQEIAFYFPQILSNIRGKVTGGMFFASVGGIAGFILIALIALIFSMLFNVMSSFLGGIRFKIKHKI